MNRLLGIWFLCLFVHCVGVGCRTGQEPPLESSPLPSTQASIAATSGTATSSESFVTTTITPIVATSSPTSTRAPSSTPTATPTATPTPIPIPEVAISVDTASATSLLAEIGRGMVNELTYSPDGDRLALASSSGVLLFDSLTGEQILFLQSGNNVKSVTFSEDGTILISVDAEGVVTYWDAETGSLSRTITDRKVPVQKAIFDPKGEIVALVYGRDVRLFSLVEELWLTQFFHSTSIQTVAFHPHEHYVAAATWDGVVKVWDIKAKEYIAELMVTEDGSSVESVAFGPDGNLLATGSQSGTIQVWDTSNWQEKQATFDYDGAVMDLAFSPDGATIFAAGRDAPLLSWDFSANVMESLMPIDTGSILNQVEVSPSGEALGLVYDNGIVGQLDTVTNELLRLTDLQLGMMYAVAFSPDGKMLATVGDDSAVRLWDATTFDLVASLSGHTPPIQSLAFDPDSTVLASGDRDSVYLWDLSSMSLRERLTGHEVVLPTYGNILALAFVPEQSLVASGGRDGDIILWDTEEGTVEQRLLGEGAVDSLVLMPDGQHLLAGGGDGVVLWQLANPATLVDVGSPTWRQASVGPISQDGSRVIIILWRPRGATSTVYIVDTHTFEHEVSLFPEGPIYSTALSPANDIVATAGAEGMIQLWDTNTGELIHTITHSGNILALNFSPTGKHLASASDNGTVKIWGIVP